MATKKPHADPAIATNRRARHEYLIEESLETGIALQGSEIKSLREGRASLQDAFAQVKDREVYLFNAHIPPYSHGGYANHVPTRPRKLLLHRAQIARLVGQTKEKGMTLIPLKMYFKGHLVKVELGLAKAKRLYDRRQDLAKKDAEREMARAQRVRTRKEGK
ncbi:MAG: SsrA-binding protein SmpB [Actinomycetota bacterium]